MIIKIPHKYSKGNIVLYINKPYKLLISIFGTLIRQQAIYSITETGYISGPFSWMYTELTIDEVQEIIKNEIFKNKFLKEIS